MKTESGKSFARVILPLKLRGGQIYTYKVPEELREKVLVGSRVTVPIVNVKYLGVVCELTDSADFEISRLRSILSVEPYPPIRPAELEFWKQLADYYMCTIGEVYAAACPSSMKPVTRKITEAEETLQATEEKATPAPIEANSLTEKQNAALEKIKEGFSKGRTVLLNGVTGSGKTEIYIHLITETLESGRNALFMLPEKAVSRQLTTRLKKVFGDAVLVFHSGIAIARRKEIIRVLSRNGTSPKLIIGLRSSVFLPFGNLGLVIVDEEHDASYKQSEPAPRYHGRDAALMLAKILGADVLLGSATPSFESLYNVKAGRYGEVILDEKFNEAPEPFLTIVDMKKKRRERAVNGSISFILRDAIKARLERGEQTIVFRSRRAYSPAVQCNSCGDIPHCPRCNTSLTYHKFSNTLSCHICGWTYRLTSDRKCPSCQEGALEPLGAGTEKIEEELRAMFPGARVARYDADISEGKEGVAVLKNFAEGNTDILVGTQMISKGFDFPGLTLAAVIQGESLLGINDFRADEKALQLFTQIRGRVGRRSVQGEIIIQTAIPEHPVFKLNDIGLLLEERKEFGFPPYRRMIEIVLKDKNLSRLDAAAREVAGALAAAGIKDFDGPVPGAVEKQQDEHILKFTLRMERNRGTELLKRRLMEKLSPLDSNWIVNVDPL